MGRLLLHCLLLFDFGTKNLVQVQGFSSSSSSSLSSQQQVKVHVERHLPNFGTPQEAREAWLDFVWEKGGGLPLLSVWPQKSRDATTNLETTIERRLLFPIGMEEQLIQPPPPHRQGDEYEDSSSIAQVKYQVTKSGLLSTEIVPDSHLGIVTFESVDPTETATTPKGESATILMKWDVTFDTTESTRTFIWQAVTERTITDTCNNFQAAVATPQLYQRITFLRTSSSSSSSKDTTVQLTPEQAMNQWIQFCWKEGGGFPLPIPPIIIAAGDDKNNKNKNSMIRWIVPPFLKERLVSSSTKQIRSSDGNDAQIAQIHYQVENPSQFIYQVYSHRGRVTFLMPQKDDEKEEEEANHNHNDNTLLRMKWEIEVRPYPEPWTTIVKAFTAAVVSSYARNFKCHIQEGGKDAMVSLKPPRGGVGGGSNTLLQVRKDSWLGGVLGAHLQDQRGTVEQTMAIFQPWTWGRTSKDDEKGEGELWTEGYLSDNEDELDTVVMKNGLTDAVTSATTVAPQD